MTDRLCERCRSFLPADTVRNGWRWFVATCTHPSVVNQHGTLAVSMARAHDGRCGPDGKLWRPA